MILYIVSGWPARCKVHAEHCCAKPATFDAKNVDLRPNRDVHIYLPDFERGKDFVVHFARNVRGVHGTREVLMKEWDSDPNRTSLDWHNRYAKQRAGAMLKAANATTTLTARAPHGHAVHEAGTSRPPSTGVARNRADLAGASGSSQHPTRTRGHPNEKRPDRLTSD